MGHTSNGELIAAHEDFAQGVPGGCRAVFRFDALRDLRLLRRKLEGIQFIGCDLSGGRFAESDLRFASFYCSRLEQCDFRGSDLTRADLRGVSLRGTRLNGARLDEADFRSAELARIDEDERFVRHVVHADRQTHDGADGLVASVDFSHCSLKGARLNGARLQGADFSDAILSEADLSGANLLGARFNGAIMTGVALANTRLDADALSGALQDPTSAAHDARPGLQASIRAGNLWTLTQGREGEVPRFDGEDLRVCGRDFSGVALAGASLRNCCAVGVPFTGARLIGAVFDGADLRDADFTGADLRGVSFRNCKLAHARFSSCDLRSLEGSGGRRFAPRFEGSAPELAWFFRCETDARARQLDRIFIAS
ncbi:pentapeptide repeat-containing protein [Maricaulis virginensis]|uniref:Pentapeptide repeat-containing protein n=1 Tax=Maricaulis virginensis TaxID=144022 RepID=A0A9W6IL30_9PROT|nr:pentapeptide repeat-containing protein [Maricaulis virginensis]GLK52248.1 hypothetical protein GCM10017621_17560 [Maricaulis virginensis]